MSEYKYIIVDGLIKSGKTRLAEILAKEFNARLILDNKENPYTDEHLNSLSGSENSLSLKTQLIHLLNRYSQQMEVSQKGLFQKATISDYTFFRDGIYAHILLGDEELGIYKKIFNIFSEHIPHPDIIIYLQISFTEMLKRIHQSENEEIKSVPQEYWREVFEAFNYYFFNYKSSPLLVVNMEKVDLNNETDVNHLLKEIKQHTRGTRYYAPA